ncbi:YgaP family membrane protein [Microbulbifer yueqingensis]|uniref:Inner membrane protein YgaP-like transmembrane domain-containing protein n=1 Tax=Microbulbifer yueqingensis TaxID=658219 RepID=A0A1G9DI62_9GAMM|nr:DUF2892 domain-containing protein [Microbulbifer yueqingensis]SDK63530.1 Protein of unknown function [Microbulbifer yueqingensis]
MEIQKNVGTLDRLVRLALAAVIAALYFTGTISGMTAAVLGLVAVIFILTGALRWCPLYRLFGLRTCGR